MNRESLSESDVVLSLLVEHDSGRNENIDMKVQRIGEEWKISGH